MFKSSIWVTLLQLSSNGLSFLNQIAIASFFGASREVDVYLASSSIPLVVSGMICSIISYSIVPKIASLSPYPNDQSIFIYSFLILVVVGSGLLGVTGYLSAIWLIGYFKNSTALAVLICQITWIIASCQIIGSYFTAVSLAFKHFVIPSIAGLFPYLGMLLFTIMFGKTVGILATTFGLLIGSILSLVYLGIRLKHIIAPSICRKLIAWAEIYTFIKNVPLVAIATICFSIYAVIDSFIAPQIGEAALSYLGYSQRIIIGMGGVMIVGPSAVIVPNLSRASAEGRLLDFRHQSFRILGIVIMMALPLSIIIANFSAGIVRLFLFRGAFGEAAVSGVAEVLSIMGIGMIPMLAVVILFRILYCLGKIIPQAITGFLWATTYLVCSLALIPYYGLTGIAYAYTVSWTISFIVCIVILERTTRC